MTGVAARAAAGGKASASRQGGGGRIEGGGIGGEGRGRERRDRFAAPALVLSARAGGPSSGGAGLQGAAHPGAPGLDRMAGARPAVSDRVTGCLPPGGPDRSPPVRVAAGGSSALSPAGGARDPSSITTYRWPVTRTVAGRRGAVEAKEGWPRPPVPVVPRSRRHASGGGVASQREQRDVVLALLGQHLDDLVGQALHVVARAAGDLGEAPQPGVEAARARLDEAVGVEDERPARPEREGGLGGGRGPRRPRRRGPP